MLARLARLMLRHPAGSLGGLLALGVWSAVAVNAVALQSGPHPAPLLGRSDEMTARVAVPRPAPESRNASDVRDPEAEAEQRRAREEEMALVRDIQKLLADRGFYAGEPDGLHGGMTEDAIRAFQRKAGLEETGRPTVALFAQIQLSSYVAPPVPDANPLRDPPQTSEHEDGPGMPSMSTLTGDDLALVPPEPAQPESDPRVEAVQRVLADLGYAPGRIDGQMGPQTSAAIRRFEEDRGMTPSGEISERLLRELSAVSGMSLG